MPKKERKEVPDRGGEETLKLSQSAANYQQSCPKVAKDPRGLTEETAQLSRH